MITQYQRGQILYKEGNVEQAKYWWKQAAHQGHRDAQFKLGAVLYEEVFFEGDKGDVEQAKYWLEQAANQRHRTAQFYLSMLLHLKEMNFGQSTFVNSDWMKMDLYRICTEMLGRFHYDNNSEDDVFVGFWDFSLDSNIYLSFRG